MNYRGTESSEILAHDIARDILVRSRTRRSALSLYQRGRRPSKRAATGPG